MPGLSAVLRIENRVSDGTRQAAIGAEFSLILTPDLFQNHSLETLFLVFRKRLSAKLLDHVCFVISRPEEVRISLKELHYQFNSRRITGFQLGECSAESTRKAKESYSEWKRREASSQAPGFSSRCARAA